MCKVCDPACANCTGPGDYNCIACQPGYFYQPTDSSTVTCKKTCPPGWEVNLQEGICEGKILQL